jgi:hypothetical protein
MLLRVGRFIIMVVIQGFQVPRVPEVIQDNQEHVARVLGQPILVIQEQQDRMVNQDSRPLNWVMRGRFWFLE